MSSTVHGVLQIKVSAFASNLWRTVCPCKTGDSSFPVVYFQICSILRELDTRYLGLEVHKTEKISLRRETYVGLVEIQYHNISNHQLFLQLVRTSVPQRRRKRPATMNRLSEKIVSRQRGSNRKNNNNRGCDIVSWQKRKNTNLPEQRREHYVPPPSRPHASRYLHKKVSQRFNGDRLVIDLLHLRSQKR
jgi:hypothetical protein